MIFTIIRLIKGVVLVYIVRKASRAAVAGAGTALTVACGAGALWLVPGANMAWVAPPVTSVASLFVLGSFPGIVKAIHRSGTTLTDIEEKLVAPTDATTATTRRVLYTFFTCALVFTTAVSVGMILDYTFFFHGGASQLTSVESIGVIGGMMSLAKRIQRKLGAGLIMVHSGLERFVYAVSLRPGGGSNGGGNKKSDDNGVDTKGVGADIVQTADEVLESVLDIV